MVIIKNKTLSITFQSRKETGNQVNKQTNKQTECHHQDLNTNQFTVLY